MAAEHASSRPLSIAMHGATGRMGTRIIHLLADDPTLVLGAAIDRPDHVNLGHDAGVLIGLGPLGEPLTADLHKTVDVVIDFSTPEATLSLARKCAEGGVPLVVGTTGFTPEARRELESFAATIPLFISANFSKAVNLLFQLAGEAAKALGSSADIEIVERHHRFKADAPSGTALRIAEVVATAIGSTSADYAHGRSGQTGVRPAGQIGLHALRTGDNPGEHTIIFGLMGECLEISHRALNRDGFARGALDAAKFLAGKPPGLYTMADLLAAPAP